MCSAAADSGGIPSLPCPCCEFLHCRRPPPNQRDGTQGRLDRADHLFDCGLRRVDLGQCDVREQDPSARVEDLRARRAVANPGGGTPTAPPFPSTILPNLSSPKARALLMTGRRGGGAPWAVRVHASHLCTTSIYLSARHICEHSCASFSAGRRVSA